MDGDQGHAALAAYLAISAASAIASNAHPEPSAERLALLAIGIVPQPLMSLCFASIKSL